MIHFEPIDDEEEEVDPVWHGEDCSSVSALESLTITGRRDAPAVHCDPSRPIAHRDRLCPENWRDLKRATLPAARGAGYRPCPRCFPAGFPEESK